MFVPAVDREVGVTGLAWLTYDGEERCVNLRTNLLHISQSLVVIGAKVSIRTHQKVLYDHSKLLAGEQTGLEVNDGASAQSNNFFIQCCLQGVKRH